MEIFLSEIMLEVDDLLDAAAGLAAVRESAGPAAGPAEGAAVN